MEITTKFDLDDEIFYIKDGEVKQGFILDYYVKYDNYFIQPANGNPFTLNGKEIMEFTDVKVKLSTDIDTKIKVLQDQKTVLADVTEEIIKEIAEV